MHYIYHIKPSKSSNKIKLQSKTHHWCAAQINLAGTHTHTHTQTQNAVNMARDTCLRTVKAASHYTVYKSRYTISKHPAITRQQTQHIHNCIKVQYFLNIFYSMNQGTLRQTKDLENAEWVGQFYVQLEDTWHP